MKADAPVTDVPGQDRPSAASLTGGRLLARNAAGNLLSQGVPMAVGLVSMPWLIRGLGIDRFGVLTLSWMVLGYFSLFDLGLGRALTKLVAEKLGIGEDDQVPGLIWTAMGLMSALGLAGAAVTAALTPWLVDTCLGIEGPLRGESLAAFYLMAAALPFLIGTAGLRGVMEAHQRVKAVNVVRASSSLVILLGPLVLLPFTSNVAAAVAVAFAARLVSWGLHVVICIRSLPSIRRGPTFRAEFVRPLLSYGGWMTAVNVVNPLMVQMDRFFIGALISTAAVAYYTTPYELVTKSWFLSNAVLGVIFPAFATSYVGDRPRTALIFDRCLRYVGLILYPIALVSVALGHEILTAWLGDDFARQGTRVMQWLAVGVLLNGVANVPSSLIQGIGRPDLTLKIHLAELGPYLAVVYVLIRARGIEGAAIAWAGRTAVDVVLYFVTAAWLLPEARPAVSRASRVLLVAVAVLAASALPFGLAYRATVCAVAASAFAVLAWSRILPEAERAMVLARLGGARRRLSPKGRPAFRAN